MLKLIIGLELKVKTCLMDNMTEIFELNNNALIYFIHQHSELIKKDSKVEKLI